MRQELLGLLACPECGHAGLDLEVLRAEGEETAEGLLACGGCGRQFPVIGGVPRLLPDALIGAVAQYHPEFYHQHGLASPAPAGGDATARTLRFFTRQRPELYYRELSPELAEYFADSLRLRIPAAAGWPGKLGLDAGCGEGRYTHCLAGQGARVVGMDLGNAVDQAYQRNRQFPHVHIVQGSIYQPPFRRGSFEFVMSIGVLHHLPDPAAGFAALAPLVAAGGTMAVWVYGLAGMSPVYRLSHLAPLRRLTSGLPPALSYLAGLPLAFALHLASLAAYLPGLWRRLDPQLREILTLPLRVKAAEVHDRLGAPVTHFPTAEELEEWLAAAHFAKAAVTKTPGGRGWYAEGHAPA